MVYEAYEALDACAYKPSNTFILYCKLLKLKVQLSKFTHKKHSGYSNK